MGSSSVTSKPFLVGFGIAIFLVIFMLSWTDGLIQAQNLCKDGISCNPLDIMMTMVMALGKLWVFVFVVVLILFAVEVVLIGIITKPMASTDAAGLGMDGGGFISDIGNNMSATTIKTASDIDGNRLIQSMMDSLLAIKVMFSWLTDPVTLIGILAAFAITFAFAIVYIVWMWLKAASSEDYEAVIYNVYVFYLVSMLSMVSAQFILHQWWRKGI